MANDQPNAGAAVTLSIQGMTCQGCVRKATEALQGIEGVESATVRLDLAQATIRLLPGSQIANADLTAAIDAAGFEARSVTPEEAGGGGRGSATLWSGWKLNVLLGAPATLFFMIGEWGFGLGMTGWFHWAGFAVAAPVQILCGGKFYRGAWRQLRRGQSNMDTLVSMGSTTAFAYSAWGLFAGWESHLYFMEAVGIITFVSVGHWLEALTSSKAAGAMEALLNLAPERATRLADDGSEQEVAVAELGSGDRVNLKPGDRVPVDGSVVNGYSAVDESMLTGESIPVEKSPNDPLYSGTINQSGQLTMRVTATGEDTALAQIIAIVQKAQSSRANIQKLGDRVSSVFVPIVIGVALLTAAFWGLAPDTANAFSQSLSRFLWPISPPELALGAAVMHAAAVLIIACPCAMGLATPIAIMAGANAAARRGILIRDGEALEKSGRIDTVIFDKTGTLTEGRPAVVARKDYSAGADFPEDPLQLAVALAGRSNHPLSRAVADSITQTERAPLVERPLNRWTELPGQGILAESGSKTLRLGSLVWLTESEVDLEMGGSFAKQWLSRGATVIGFSNDRELVSLFAIQDPLKSGANSVIKGLNRAGLATWMVSGDLQIAAEKTARMAGIPKENIRCEVKPEEKAEIVRSIQSKGLKVAFVGDGINDAPALKQADLGIAVSRASDVAREAADIVLLNTDILAIPEAIGLARATLRTIKQNLFWAFFYNAVGIPLAALGFLNPMLCAAAMGFSDLVVVGNALRLRRWR